MEFIHFRIVVEGGQSKGKRDVSHHPRVVTWFLADDTGREFARDLGYYSNLDAVCNAGCEIAAEDNEFRVSVRKRCPAG